VNKQLTMLYKIKNAGKSTAEITNVSLNAEPELVYPLKYAPVSELAPTQIAADSTEEFIYLGLANNGPYIVTQAVADALSSGSLKLFIYGFVDYDDDFWFVGGRRSYFCFRYVPERSSQTVSTFSGCPIPRPTN